MNKFLDDLEGCLKGILIGGFVIYFLIFLSIEIHAFGLFLLLLVIVAFFMLWIENKEEKKEQANMSGFCNTWTVPKLTHGATIKGRNATVRRFVAALFIA